MRHQNGFGRLHVIVFLLIYIPLAFAVRHYFKTEAKNAAAEQERVAQEAQIEQASKEASFQVDQRALRAQANAEDAQEALANRALASRCSDQQREMPYNQQAQAQYYDVGWQNLAHRGLDAKSLREGIDRDCR